MDDWDSDESYPDFELWDHNEEPSGACAKSPEPPMAIDATKPPSIAVKRFARHDRRGYGDGEEAARTSRFRSYDISQSRSYQWLQRGFGWVSKPMLIHLIRSIRDACPEGGRPAPPSRTQTRIKGGLVQWLDDYEIIALPLLRQILNAE
jgi:hypothetical protein